MGVREPRVARPGTQEAFAEKTPGRVPAKIMRQFGIPIPKTQEAFAEKGVAVPAEAGDAISRMDDARSFAIANIGKTRESFEAMGSVPGVKGANIEARVAEMSEMAAAQATQQDNRGSVSAVAAAAVMSTLPLVREAGQRVQALRTARAPCFVINLWIWKVFV